MRRSGCDAWVQVYCTHAQVVQSEYAPTLTPVTLQALSADTGAEQQLVRVTRCHAPHTPAAQRFLASLTPDTVSARFTRTPAAHLQSEAGDGRQARQRRRRRRRRGRGRPLGPPLSPATPPAAASSSRCRPARPALPWAFPWRTTLATGPSAPHGPRAAGLHAPAVHHTALQPCGDLRCACRLRLCTGSCCRRRRRRRLLLLLPYVGVGPNASGRGGRRGLAMWSGPRAGSIPSCCGCGSGLLPGGAPRGNRWGQLSLACRRRGHGGGGARRCTATCTGKRATCCWCCRGCCGCCWGLELGGSDGRRRRQRQGPQRAEVLEQTGLGRGPHGRGESRGAVRWGWPRHAAAWSHESPGPSNKPLALQERVIIRSSELHIFLPYLAVYAAQHVRDLAHEEVQPSQGGGRRGGAGAGAGAGGGGLPRGVRLQHGRACWRCHDTIRKWLK